MERNKNIEKVILEKMDQEDQEKINRAVSEGVMI